VLALLFGAGVYHFMGPDAGVQFLPATDREDLERRQLFRLVLIFSFFAVPQQYQHRVLFWGSSAP